jgi:tetratricopeptide (TPR) repeat protein
MKRLGWDGTGRALMCAQIATACILCGCAGSAPGSQSARVAQEPAPTELRQAQSLLDVARRALRAQRTSDAVNSSEQALLALKRGGVVSHADLIIIAYTYVDLARVLMQASRAATARGALADAMSLLKPGRKPDDAGIVYAQQALGDLSLQELDPVTALAAFSTASAVAARHKPEWASREIAALTGLAKAQRELHRPADMRSSWERALYLDEHFPDRDSPRYETILSLVAAYSSVGDPRAGQLFARYHGFQRIMDIATATFAYGTASFDRPKPAPSTALSPVSASASAPTLALGALPTELLTPPADSDPARVVKDMRAGFQACLQASPAQSAGQRGMVRLLIKVDKRGTVGAVSSLTLGLPVTLTDCLLARASTAMFDPPEGGSIVLAVPMTFVVNPPP